MLDNKEEVKSALKEKYEFRDIVPEEIAQTAEIERICFPPNEACTYEHMSDRIRKAPALFLVAVDKETGKIAGFLNGLATDREHLTDDFFENADTHEPDGDNVMLLGLDVLPEYRGQGLARALMSRYREREKKKGRKKLVLTCLDQKVEMYEKFGFTDHGIGESVWGGEPWHEMSMELEAERRIDMDLVKTALEMGFSDAAVMDTTKLVFVPEYRQFCVDNLCGNYDLNPACPPESGTVEEMKERALRYPKTLVLQTMCDQADDPRKAKLNQNKMTEKLAEEMKKAGHTDLLLMSAGPYKHHSCMSAYCVDAQKMADAVGMDCWKNDSMNRFFSQILFFD